MLINESGLVRCIKRAYKYAGYAVAVEGDCMTIYTERWYIQCKRAAIPRKVLATIVEHMGMIPDTEPVSIVKDGEPLAYFTEQPTAGMGRQLKLALDAPKDATDIDVTLYYTTEPLSYNDKNEIEQKWLSVQGTYNDGKVEVTVPAEASVYYISICSKTPSGNFYSSSRLVESPLDNPSQSGDNMTAYTAGAAIIGLISTLGVLIYKRKRYN